MADAYVQLPTDGGGKKVDTAEITVGANTVERQRISIADDSAAAGLAKVQNANPALTDYGLTMRRVGDGLSVNHIVAAANNNAARIKSGAGGLYGWSVFNNAGYPIYLKLYDSNASPPNPASATVLMTVGVQAGVRAELTVENGIAFSSGLGVAIVKGIGDTDNTSVAASDCVADVFYK